MPNVVEKGSGKYEAAIFERWGYGIAVEKREPGDAKAMLIACVTDVPLKTVGRTDKNVVDAT
jgi:hypothetical protein